MWCRSTKQRRAALRRRISYSVPWWKRYVVPIIITKQQIFEAAFQSLKSQKNEPTYVRPTEHKD